MNNRELPAEDKNSSFGRGECLFSVKDKVRGEKHVCLFVCAVGKC